MDEAQWIHVFLSSLTNSMYNWECVEDSTDAASQRPAGAVLHAFFWFAQTTCASISSLQPADEDIQIEKAQQQSVRQHLIVHFVNM